MCERKKKAVPHQILLGVLACKHEHQQDTAPPLKMQDCHCVVYFSCRLLQRLQILKRLFTINQIKT
jgi:hypothetical protein